MACMPSRTTSQSLPDVMQVYFQQHGHGSSLENLSNRAKNSSPKEGLFHDFSTSPSLLKNDWPWLSSSLDDGVMNTYFQLWWPVLKDTLADLSQRFVNRKVFKSITFRKDQDQLANLRQLVEDIGFDPDLSTAIHKNFDLPYDTIGRIWNSGEDTDWVFTKKMSELGRTFLAPVPYRPIPCFRQPPLEIIVSISQRNVGPKQYLLSITQEQFLHLIENDSILPPNKTKRKLHEY